MSLYPVVTVRASALPDFLDCAARAEAKHLLHKRTPTNGGALLGTAVHRSTALFDQSVLAGAGVTIEESAAAAVDAIHRPNDDVALEDDESVKAIESTALALHRMYCREIAPTQDYAAVEVTCERLEITDIGLALTGTTDRVRRKNGGHGISDLKSGKTAVSADGSVKTHGHAFQIGVYELLAHHASGIPITEPAEVIGLQAGKTERGQRVAKSAPISGARDVLIGEPGSPGVLEVVADMIHAGRFPGNPRSMLCHPKYCPVYSTCKFRR
jgi:hypothetical protein